MNKQSKAWKAKLKSENVCLCCHYFSLSLVDYFWEEKSMHEMKAKIKKKKRGKTEESKEHVHQLNLTHKSNGSRFVMLTGDYPYGSGNS